MASAGSQFGPYQIISLVGSGGMGEVYRARDPRLGRDVAVKILPAHRHLDPDAVARFSREARAIAALSHPGILTIHDVGEEDGQCYLVTELLEGDTLRRRLERGPLPWRHALASATVIARALAAAHARGIVHRDLKPENVFVTSDGDVKILDFGVAKLVPLAEATTVSSDTPQLTGTGAVLGTPAYMAPEQLEAREVDHRADQFAFGILLYEMLSGQRPFPGETSPQIGAAILRDAPRSLASVCDDVPDALSRIVSRCLARDPSGRYASTTDLALALDDVCADLDNGTRTVQRGVATSSLRRPGIWLAGSLAVAALLAAAIVGARWAASRSGAESVSPGVQAVAVLPFGTIGDGEPYLADGITEAVTLELGRVKNARVIAANSAFTYRGRTEGFSEIGRELGVGLLVRGSVQRAGDRVRINAALIDTRQDAPIWSEHYDRDLTDVLGVQDEIAWQIAARLAAASGSATPARPSPASSTTPDAYDAYLRGLSHVKGRSEITDARKRLAAAIAEFERAVALDANFALARGSLASAYTQRFFYDATDPAFEQKAFLEIEKALAINPDQAEAYLARAQLVWNVRNGFQHERAIADLRRALANNPSLAEAHVELGKVYYHIGLLDKAIAANEEALRLDPFASVARMRRFSTLIDGRQFQQVREELARNPPLPRLLRAGAVLAMGSPDAALEMLSDPRFPDGGPFRNVELNELTTLAHAYASLNRRPDAERALAAAIPRAVNPTGLSDIHHAQFSIGTALALLGRSDEAVRWLTKAADEGYPSYPKFSTDPDLAMLKGHAEFIALLDRLRRDWERWQSTL